MLDVVILRLLSSLSRFDMGIEKAEVLEHQLGIGIQSAQLCEVKEDERRKENIVTEIKKRVEFNIYEISSLTFPIPFAKQIFYSAKSTSDLNHYLSPSCINKSIYSTYYLASLAKKKMFLMCFEKTRCIIYLVSKGYTVIHLQPERYEKSTNW